MLRYAAVLAVTLLLPHAQAERPKQAEDLTDAAEIHRTHHRLDQAIAAFREALAINPDYVPARRGLGRVLDLVGRHEDARTEYQAGLKSARAYYEDEPVLWDLAASYVFDRRFDDAHAALQHWADLCLQRRGQDQRGSLMFFELAMAREAFDEAERLIAVRFGSIQKPPAIVRSRTPDLDPLAIWTPWVQYNRLRALVSARRGRTAEAQRYIAEVEDAMAKFDQLVREAVGPQASSASGSSTNDLDATPGEVAFWLGDNARAIRVLSNQYVKMAQYDVLLGQAYEREKNLPEARVAYARVVESTNLSIGLAWARPIAEARLAAIGR